MFCDLGWSVLRLQPQHLHRKKSDTVDRAAYTESDHDSGPDAEFECYPGAIGRMQQVKSSNK